LCSAEQRRQTDQKAYTGTSHIGLRHKAKLQLF
jgi:hypothetical protein